MPLPDVLRLVAESREGLFPVVDAHERMVGVMSLDDLRAALLGCDAGNLILASDVARSPVAKVTPEDNLHTALRCYAQRQVEEVPIVDSKNPSQVIGMLHRGEVLAAYDERMVALRSARV